MKHPFIPDRMADDVFSVTPESLTAQGIRAVVLDIDNTLVTYDMAEPTAEITGWINSLLQEGLHVSIASNGRRHRVDRFNRTLGLPVTYHSRKPSRRAIFTVCAANAVRPEEVALIGDQIFTDVWCARRAGAFSILVKPLPYHENLFFRFKRLLEKPFIRAYRRQEKKSKGEMSS